MRLLALLLPLLAVFLVLSLGREGSSARQVDLKQAVDSVRMMTDGLTYASLLELRDAESTLTRLAEDLNAATNASDAQKQELRASGQRVPTDIPFVVGAPTAPWQVVLKAVRNGGEILVQGYGPDISTPIFVDHIRLVTS